jgi:cystathionine beta-lyase
LFFVKYDFLTEPVRKNQFSVAIDGFSTKDKPAGLIPLWVADMGLKTAPEIIEALNERIRKGCFGYTYLIDDYYNSVMKWYKKYHNLNFSKDDILTAPSVVAALHICVDAFTSLGDSLLIQTPSYQPLVDAVIKQGRKLLEAKLIDNNGHYEMDFVDFENKLKKSKMFILCSPHNPTCRVWTKNELDKITQLCLKHKVLIFEDAIHADFINGNNKQYFINNISKSAENLTITAIGPTKSFNLASLQAANLIIKNKNLRNKYIEGKEKFGYPSPSLMGAVATVAAYNNGREWFVQLKKHIGNNLNIVSNFAKKYYPNVELIDPQGTYLTWWDVSKTGFTAKEVAGILEKKYGIWVYDGAFFGPEGENYIRVNLAQSSSIIDKVLKTITP